MEKNSAGSCGCRSQYVDGVFVCVVGGGRGVLMREEKDPKDGVLTSDPLEGRGGYIHPSHLASACCTT